MTWIWEIFQSVVKHAIVTKDGRPVKKRPRRTPLAFEGEEREKKNFSGVSEWASPAALVRKRDGSV